MTYPRFRFGRHVVSVQPRATVHEGRRRRRHGRAASIEQLLDGRFGLVDDDITRPLDRPHQPTWLSELTDRPLLDGPGGEEPRPPRVPEPTFVALRLLDDDGEPVPEQPLSVTLPDGRIIEGVTDAAGRFAVENVSQAGACTVRLGELVI